TLAGQVLLALRRAFNEPLLLLAAFGAILLATTTLVALTTYAGSVTEAGVQRTIETAPFEVKTTTVTTSVTRDSYSRIDHLIRERIARVYGNVPVAVSSAIRSDSYAMPD